MNIEVNSIINIFTIIDGDINLLVNNNDNLLTVNCLDNIEFVCNKYIKDNISIKNLSLNQVYTFSEKKDKLVITILYADIINIDNIKLNNKFKFIKYDKLDNKNKYISKSLDYLKKQLVLFSTVKKLYPDKFILPEIQKIYETLFNKKFDRRNFRKRLIKMNVIGDLNQYSKNKTGRPAKLYYFKNIDEDKILL